MSPRAARDTRRHFEVWDMKILRFVLFAGALTGLAASQAPAQTAQVGQLVCDVSAGVGLGEVSQGQLIWGVVAPATGVPRGALSGTYVGVGAEASAGAGLGANVLVGGTGRAFSLQPVSVEGQVGLNIAGGVTTVTLLPPPAN